MGRDSDVTAQVLSALLVLASLAATVRSVIRGRTLAKRVEARPDGRVWLYRNFVLRMWPLMVLPPAIVWASSRITAADLGWTWPHGVVGYLLAAYYLLLLMIAGFRMRARMRRGVVLARRQRVMFMAPRTARERWWVVALSLTAGITEEVLYRGALPAVGVHIYHLPYVAAASAALLLFAAAHLYQGRIGLLSSAAVGFVFAVLYALSGSLLLPILVHASQDLVTLLLIPAASTPQPPAIPPTPPTVAPPTVAPPTVAPPTVAPPTVARPTVAPPTVAPPTVAPPTVVAPADTTDPARTIPRRGSTDAPPTIRTAVPDRADG